MLPARVFIAALVSLEGLPPGRDASGLPGAPRSHLLLERLHGAPPARAPSPGPSLAGGAIQSMELLGVIKKTRNFCGSLDVEFLGSSLEVMGLTRTLTRHPGMAS